MSFFLFFSEFSFPGQEWTEFGTKIFVLTFSANFIPFWLKNNAGKEVFSFFCYFFRTFLARVEFERNTGLKFFSLFLGLSHPVFAKNNTKKRFLNFFIFLLFFWEFSCMGRIWTEFGTKIFLSLSRPISSRFGWK